MRPGGDQCTLYYIIITIHSPSILSGGPACTQLSNQAFMRQQHNASHQAAQYQELQLMFTLGASPVDETPC